MRSVHMSCKHRLNTTSAPGATELIVFWTENQFLLVLIYFNPPTQHNTRLCHDETINLCMSLLLVSLLNFISYITFYPTTFTHR